MQRHSENLAFTFCESEELKRDVFISQEEVTRVAGTLEFKLRGHDIPSWIELLAQADEHGGKDMAIPQMHVP